MLKKSLELFNINQNIIKSIILLSNAGITDDWEYRINGSTKKNKKTSLIFNAFKEYIGNDKFYLYYEEINNQAKVNIVKRFYFGDNNYIEIEKNIEYNLSDGKIIKADSKYYSSINYGICRLYTQNKNGLFFHNKCIIDSNQLLKYSELNLNSNINIETLFLLGEKFYIDIIKRSYPKITNNKELNTIFR